MRKERKAKDDIFSEGYPYCRDAERGVIACLLSNPEEIMVDLISTGAISQFYHPSHVTLLSEIRKLVEQKKPVDLISVTSSLISSGEMDHVGGPGEVAELFSMLLTAAHYPHYLSIIREKFLLRSVMIEADRVKELASQPSVEATEVVQSFYGKASEILNFTVSNNSDKKINIQVEEWMDNWQSILDGKKPSSMPSRWKSLNDVIGIRPGYTVVMGPRKSGKSCIGYNIMTDGVLRHGRPGIIGNYELGMIETMNRIASDYANIHQAYLFQPDVMFNSPGATPKRVVIKAISEAMKAIRDSKLQIICNPLMTVEEFAYKARAKKSAEGDLMFMIDYLQLLPDSHSNRKETNREQDVARNSAVIRRLSKELECPGIILSQTNKDGSTRESLAPEQDCDLALRIDGDDGVFVSANRNGPSKIHLPMFLEGEHFRFVEKRYSDIPN